MDSSLVFQQKRRIAFLWVSAPVLIAFALLSGPAWSGNRVILDIFEVLGVFCIVACLAGRLWAAMYVGDRKNIELVQGGPYSISRNPLYFFSSLGMFGVGLMTGSITVAIVLAGFTYGVFRYVIAKEEKDLHALFGARYESYSSEVPRFFPRLFRAQSWRISSATINVVPQAMLRNSRDAAYFLLAIPLSKVLDYLHATKAIPVLFHLY